MTHDDGGKRVSRVIGGILLLTLGVVFLLQNLGFIHVGRIWDFWPMFMVWAGLARLFAPGRGLHVAGGAVLLALGVFFQLDQLGFVWIRARDFWPALLVIAGVALVLESLLPRRRNGYGRGPNVPAGPGDPR